MGFWGALFGHKNRTIWEQDRYNRPFLTKMGNVEELHTVDYTHFPKMRSEYDLSVTMTDFPNSGIRCPSCNTVHLFAALADNQTANCECGLNIQHLGLKIRVWRGDMNFS